MPRLVLLNGPPGVGKSTLAHRLVRDWPLALVVEIDALRGSLGGWRSRPESKTIARELGIALALRQLELGHDVVVPQLLVLPDFADRLRAVADSAGVSLIEIVVLASAEVVRERFLERRAAFAASPSLATIGPRTALARCRGRCCRAQPETTRPQPPRS